MPYASNAQRKFMHARHPEIAKRWDKEGGKVKPVTLPAKVKGKQVPKKTAAPFKPRTASPARSTPSARIKKATDRVAAYKAKKGKK